MIDMLAALLGGGVVFVAVGGCDRLAASIRLGRVSDGGRRSRPSSAPNVMPQPEQERAVQRGHGRVGDGARGQPSPADAKRPAYGVRGQSSAADSVPPAYGMCGQSSAADSVPPASSWRRVQHPRSGWWLALRSVDALRRLPARRRVERQNRSAVLGLCAALVAELRGGRQPREALDRAGLAWPTGAPRALSAARGGDEVADALKLDAKEPGRGGLRALAVCWQVAEHHGTGLAAGVGQITTSLRTDEEHRRRLAAELAGPRATARLLALLPLVGIAMGQALDAEPLRMLVTTSWGRLALVAGISLEVCGTWWVNRIANDVERSL